MAAIPSHVPMRAAGRRRLGWPARVALVGFGLLLPLLLLELALRVLGPILPGDYQTQLFTVSSEVVGRRNNPNTAVWLRGPDYVTWVRVNSKGLRGPEIPYEKPPGTYRILVVGDSFTFAHQVTEEETFVVRLAEQLREARPEANVETINAGTDGWSTANEYAWLRSEGYKYEPDLVLLMFYTGNDPAGNAKHVGSPEQVDRLDLAIEGSDVPFRDLRAALSRVSVTWNMIEWGLLAKLQPRSEADQREAAEARGQLDRDAEERLSSLNSDEKVRGWAISEALLARMRDFAADRKMRLVVVSIPAYGVVIDQRRRDSPLTVIGERLGLSLIDLLDPFRAAPRRQREKLYLENDLHWTRDGNALAARAVAAELLRRGIVPGA